MKNFGKRAETVATWYLRLHGYQILECNFHSRFGEIDIIAKKLGTIAFIEVKARGNNEVAPAYAVTDIKQQKIIKTAHHFITKHRLNDNCMSFDVIEIVKSGMHYKINHIKNAFEIN